MNDFTNIAEAKLDELIKEGEHKVIITKFEKSIKGVDNKWTKAPEDEPLSDDVCVSATLELVDSEDPQKGRKDFRNFFPICNNETRQNIERSTLKSIFICIGIKDINNMKYDDVLNKPFIAYYKENSYISKKTGNKVNGVNLVGYKIKNINGLTAKEIEKGVTSPSSSQTEKPTSWG